LLSVCISVYVCVCLSPMIFETFDIVLLSVYVKKKVKQVKLSEVKQQVVEAYGVARC
jgi:hypothetical protein